MASACVNHIGVPPETFLDCPSSAFPAFGWFSPRISFSRERKLSGAPEISDPVSNHRDFEFCLDYSVSMLPADELFSDGKLVPLHAWPVTETAAAASESAEEEVRSPEARKSCSGNEVDPHLFSPKAPRCSSRWRELLGLKKNKQESNSKVISASDATTSCSSTSVSTSSSSSKTGKSIRHFLRRSSKSMSISSSDASLNLPLLKESDYESLSISSSRLSLSSSSSSGHDHDDLHRRSLDADIRPSHIQISLPRSSSGPNQRVRMVKPRMVPSSVAENPKPLIDHPSAPATAGRSVNPGGQQDLAAVNRGISLDSPRMNSSGKIVFQSLERSCSSPSSFNGAPRHRYRGVERSHSANVRITPVLNVPVCSIRFGQLFSSQSQKKESNGPNGGSSKSLHQYHLCNRRPRRENSSS